MDETSVAIPEPANRLTCYPRISGG